MILSQRARTTSCFTQAFLLWFGLACSSCVWKRWCGCAASFSTRSGEARRTGHAQAVQQAEEVDQLEKQDCLLRFAGLSEELAEVLLVFWVVRRVFEARHGQERLPLAVQRQVALVQHLRPARFVGDARVRPVERSDWQVCLGV